MKGFAIGSYVQVAYLDQRHLNERVGQVHEYGKGKDGGNVIRVRFKEAILSLSSGILINQSQLKTKIRFNIALERRIDIALERRIASNCSVFMIWWSSMRQKETLNETRIASNFTVQR